MDETKVRGSCLCGCVRYEVEGRIGDLSHCHCSMCRKAHGAAFGTYGKVAWEGFRITSGEHLVKTYRSSADVSRTFCANCGAALQFIRDGKAGFGLAVGTLDSDCEARATAQIWTRDKAPWWDLERQPPAFDTYPP